MTNVFEKIDGDIVYEHVPPFLVLLRSALPIDDIEFG